MYILDIYAKIVTLGATGEMCLVVQWPLDNTPTFQPLYLLQFYSESNKIWAPQIGLTSNTLLY